MYCLGLGISFRSVFGMNIMVVVDAEYNELFVLNYSLKKFFYFVKVEC